MTLEYSVQGEPSVRELAELAANDWERFMFEGLGIMPTTEQIEARMRLGRPGPRERGDPKFDWISGGQRAGKTVELAAWHIEACLYKIGVDVTDPRFWGNYAYGTLAVAPSNELTLKLWQIVDDISKGANDAQWDRRSRSGRRARFRHLFKCGTTQHGPIVNFDNGAHIDFRSTEGWAMRLEGGQWWFITWDEWASQPDAQIDFVLTDVLMGRGRDHDAKIVPAAWPKPETERHIISVIRKVEQGMDPDSIITYLSAEAAWFSNRSSLKAERVRKTDAQWMRTVLGRPAGGASIEFPKDVLDNMVDESLTYPMLPEDGYHYFNSWDMGMGHDSTVGITWRIPQGDVTPENKARIVNITEIKGGETVTLDGLAYAVAKEQLIYRAQSAVDATGFGGTAAFRQIRDLHPPPLAFKAKSNDRIYGNMRLAAITNGLDLLTWGRDETGEDGVWGLIESPKIVALLDQMANFDRDAKNVEDDYVSAFLIGCWYIKRFYVRARGAHIARPFNMRRTPRIVVDMRGAN